MRRVKEVKEVKKFRASAGGTSLDSSGIVGLSFLFTMVFGPPVEEKVAGSSCSPQQSEVNTAIMHSARKNPEVITVIDS